MHGQAIAKEIEKRKGYRPSPGTIYPALKMMREAGLVKEMKEGKQIIYELTSEGKKVLAGAKKEFCKMFIGIYG